MSVVNGFNSITSNTSLVVATGHPDHRDASDARFHSENKNLGSQQMPTRRKLLAKASRTQVKKSLGFQSGTHYETMLHNPTSKLKQFMYPGMKALDNQQM